MRSYADIAGDVLHAAKEHARLSTEEVNPRTGPQRAHGAGASATTAASESALLGYPVPKRGSIVNNGLIDRLRADHAY